MALLLTAQCAVWNFWASVLLHVLIYIHKALTV